ncbi:hypothetical protein DP939_28965 [Spongiactinospora rosea]|uniref:Uncharacterized protein n=2 Tax=Spongiactinospora rosea TaxID=2248750 RepID=A0A366LS38_9ACTN|nr:hypothetical protein DP939_28965 [Spongiactinospora rosea]
MRRAGTEDLLRELTPRVLGAVVRRYGHFDTAEDAVQEALLAAARSWPDGGTPDDPGLALLPAIESDERMAGDHRPHAVRAHLLEMAGEHAAARAAYLAAAERTTSLPQQRYLHTRAARLVAGPRSDR